MEQKVYSRTYMASSPKEAMQWFRNDNKSKGRTMNYKIVHVGHDRDGWAVSFTQTRKKQQGYALTSLSGRRF